MLLRPAEDATRVDFRVSLSSAGIGVGLSAILAVIAGSAALFPEQVMIDGAGTTETVMAWLCTGLFSLPVVLMAAALVKTRRSQGLLIDASGVWWYGPDAPDPRLVCAWTELGAVAITWKQSPAPGIAQPVRPVLGHALEVYATGPLLDDRLDRLTRVSETERPVLVNPPPCRYRLVLPEAGMAEVVEGAVHRFAPTLWAGSHRRQWNPVPGA
ncbi:hypothetical protein [Krasilnikovia sp. M28-CT-15]|uniref:hypothetical protein n=1 Tax=Krasilnikovia sp. M28-CT-15 TaxID=3373540 RepID=UPI0038762D92